MVSNKMEFMFLTFFFFLNYKTLLLTPETKTIIYTTLFFSLSCSTKRLPSTIAKKVSNGLSSTSLLTIPVHEPGHNYTIIYEDCCFMCVT